MIESQQVLEWINMGRAEGEARGEVKGEIKGEIKSLLRALATLFPPGAPDELETIIRAATSEEQLQNWLDLALKADSLDAFRQSAGL